MTQMTLQELESYVHEHIPLSAAMQVRYLQAAPDCVMLAAPLAPNINHRDTVFGGSASAVAILAAWSLVFVRLKEAGMQGRVIIHSNSMHYDKPIAGDFTATAQAPEAASWHKLENALQRGRMARIEVATLLKCEGLPVGRLNGEFVVLPPA
jgi:thioesterase domain-containing protein